MDPIYNGFVYVVWFISTYYVVALGLSLLWGRRELYETRELTSVERVSILVPAFNEASGIRETIRSLKALDYPDLEVIVLDDGSSDHTPEIALDEIGSDERFRLERNPHNMGKAATLNRGIALASGTLIGTMDADSMLAEDVLRKAVPYFADERVGAVTVTVEVNNRHNLLNAMFDLEFRIGLSLLLKVFSWHDTIFVTPGPFSMYRASALERIGGFDEHNLTEDLEVAYRLIRHGFRIENALEAVVRTNLPETWRGTYVQRRRWYAGALQTLTKHRDMLFTRRHGLFGLVIPFNYILIFTGMALFAATLVLTGQSAWHGLVSLRYAGFDIRHQLASISIDPLRLGTVTITGILGILSTLAILAIGLSVGRSSRRARLIGILGYPALFIVYQIFWAGAIVAFVTRRGLTWR